MNALLVRASILSKYSILTIASAVAAYCPCETTRHESCFAISALEREVVSAMRELYLEW